MKKQLSLFPCSAFGGRTDKGKLVGSRHRWPDGWGKGRCQYCGNTLDALRY